MDARIGWRILNPDILTKTDHVPSLLEASHRSRTVTLPRVDTPWLRRLGLSGAHIDPASDIVCFGHPTDESGTNKFMTGLSLVLGNEFPNIMVSAAPFVRYTRDLQEGSVDPVSRALATLRAVDPVWDQIFRPEGGGPLHSPGLPRNIYYYFSNPPRVPHCIHAGGSGPFCLHYEHLKIATWDEGRKWAMSYRGRSDYDWRCLERRDYVKAIKTFWDNVRMLPGFADRIPNVFFVEIKTISSQEFLGSFRAINEGAHRKLRLLSS